MSITNTGTVTFEGKRFVATTGTATTHIDASKVAALQTTIDEHDFYSLDDKYAYGEPNCKEYATDAPTVIITVSSKDKTKRVEHDAGCMNAPHRIGDLQKKIDSIANVSYFISEQRAK